MMMCVTAYASVQYIILYVYTPVYNMCIYQWRRSADVDEFLHATLKARLKHVRVDSHEALALFICGHRS